MRIGGLERFRLLARRLGRRDAADESQGSGVTTAHRQTGGVSPAVRWGAGVVTAALALSVAALCSCNTPSPPLVGGNQAAAQPGSQADSAEPPRQPDLAAAVEGLSGAYGIAVVPVGSTSVVSAGNWSSGWAWSTIKVPVSVAAVRDDDGTPTPTTSRLLRQAITMSDNDAARALYRGLGGGTSGPSSAVEEVLRDAGDRTTEVKPGYFGTTRWSLTDQAVFAAGLPCIEGSAPVLDLMDEITTEHRWGLGELSQTRFKGGWGQNSKGQYLVRQLGVVSLPDGTAVGVALAGEPSDGTYETAIADLGRMARWLSSKLPELSGGRC